MALFSTPLEWPDVLPVFSDPSRTRLQMIQDPLGAGVLTPSYWFQIQWTPAWVVSGSSTPDSSTPDSSTIYTLQLLIASHKQFRGFWGAEPPVLAFSLGVLGLVSQEYDVLVFSV